ncbi:cell division transport system permease protein [Catenibacillus scindens]|uniref:Cell division protein FtsX n=1 Tax=Catenibacillus scindens TaxID=673271 RepID=A0A7W8M423_9FIRM|nr:cell division transport system permease protein [Catenibacillus scindens]
MKNIFRNHTFSLASIGTITSCLFLFGIFFCVLVNFQGLMKNMETSVGVTVFFKDGVTEERILEIRDTVELRDEVASVTYVSEDEAWNQFKEQYFPDGDEGILTNLDEDNPLTGMANLEISLSDASQQSDLVTYLESFEEVDHVNSLDSVAASFADISRLVSYVALAIILILILVAIFLISNTVRIGIAVRREEIAIMKYIGATDIFVRGPFLVEGIVIGLVGSLIPVAIIRFLYVEVVQFVTGQFPVMNVLMNFVPVQRIFIILLPVSLVIGLGIGFIGSYITLRKHIRV